MIYLDNAATTFPKPPGVAETVLSVIRERGGNPGRGAHRLSLSASELIYTCRERLADFFGLEAPEGIVFTENTTYALNMLLKGSLDIGDHVLISELEHNAIRRPLLALEKTKGVSHSVFPVVGKSTGEILLAIEKAITPKTGAIITTHASNICSLTLPIKEIGQLCRRRGIKFFVDAAQSAGHLPINMKAMHIDALAAPGHKSLFGIQGCGILALSPGMQLRPIIEGGSGMDSRSEEMPLDPPERFEAGTLPTPAIAGLLAGLDFVEGLGLPAIEKREKRLFWAARERLMAIPGVKIHCPTVPGAILLFEKQGLAPTEIATHLDRAGICVRAGLHCAPLAHGALGTLPAGAVRVSFSPLNTVDDVDALWRAMQHIT